MQDAGREEGDLNLEELDALEEMLEIQGIEGTFDFSRDKNKWANGRKMRNRPIKRRKGILWIAGTLGAQVGDVSSLRYGACEIVKNNIL